MWIQKMNLAVNVASIGDNVRRGMKHSCMIASISVSCLSDGKSANQILRSPAIMFFLTIMTCLMCLTASAPRPVSTFWSLALSLPEDSPLICSLTLLISNS